MSPFATGVARDRSFAKTVLSRDERRLCAAHHCLLKSKCAGSKSRRAINRNFDEEYFEKLERYYEPEAYKKAMRKRKVWIEPMFAKVRQGRGMGRVRLGTLEG